MGGVSTTSSFLSLMTASCCGAMGHRFYTSTDASSHFPAAAEHTAGNGHDSKTHVSLLYKSTHRGSGKAELPARQSGGNKQVATNLAAAAATASLTASAAGARDEAPVRRENFARSFSSCAEDAGAVSSRLLSPLQRRQLLFKHKAAFTLTPQALRRVKYLLKQAKMQPAPNGIRIGVRRRGCSGYSYTVNYCYPEEEEPALAKQSDTQRSSGVVGENSGANGARKGDVVVEQDGVKVVVDGNALFYVIGTEMDYVVRNVEEKFTFRNPNQKYSCGCEDSFMPFDVAEQETS
ncbi:iron-sulfur cluster assembly protein [Trypanosoma rangeli]|uniref:Iron-sulfur cluster assembly protein n=1 Tax=Trypanosoma rangeli TaxID=5698 RepID=A0A422NDJ9_TRYRA|nr:iron-sulfur cluster assembly protein [Trypanosoma rangeli]RNF03409.1 iron-sulfur cluster assembly protein [Trypanosoma rangeli]|eukprot:RNF03409.1 iron-sulfur cluster assembly protein [Trypanosoma rangeli]